MGKSCSKVHEYLGIVFDYRVSGQVTIKMEVYVNGMLVKVPHNMFGTVATLAANHLFNLNDDNPVYLGDEKREVFHHLTAQALYLSQ